MNDAVNAQRKLVNVVIRNGCKGRAFKQVWEAFSKLNQEENEISPNKRFKRVLFHVCPLTELRGKRIAGVVKRIPRAISKSRELSFGLRWLVQASNKRTESSFKDRLFSELRDSVIKKSSSSKHRDDVHKLTLANRSNLKYIKRK